MRMIECNIMNFGTLSDFHYDFEHGINRIVRGNGFGKSTLAAFIRVMLYGFEGEGKRDLLSRERKFYEPWQGGNYGGDIVFEVRGKTYRVTRTFGKKADDDTFELRDMNTNLTSYDFSEKLGIELFDMDSDTFRRTVFVGQDTVETSTNDTINGRIGALVDNTDDLDAFENAKTALEVLTNSLTPRRKTGEVSRLNDRITALSADIIPAAELEKSMENILLMRNAEEDKLAGIREEKDKLAAKAKELGAYMEVATQKDRYEHLLNNREKKAAVIAEMKSRLPAAAESSDFPKPDELRRMARNYMKASADLSSIKLVELSEREEENFDLLCKYYEGENPSAETDRYMETWKLIKDHDNEIDKKRESIKKCLDEIDIEEKEKRKSSMVFVISALVFVIVAIILFLTTTVAWAGVLACTLWFVCMVLSVYISKSHARVADRHIKVCNILKRDIGILEEKKSDLMNEITSFLGKYKKDTTFDIIPVSLLEITSDYEAYLSLKCKKDKAYKASDDAKHVLNMTKDFISKALGAEPEEDPYAQLNRYADLSEKILEEKNALEVADKALEVFRRENNIDAIINASSPENSESLADVTDKLEQYTRLADESSARLIGLDKRSDELSQNLDDIETKKAEKDRLKEERDRKLEIYECCMIAKEHIISAKESLSARFVKPILDKFLYYHSKITGDKTKEYVVDANIDISVREQGLNHSVQQLSKGLRDVVGLSLRMAFIDVMFPNEKPVLILDDPFVNLDRTNLEAAQKLMELIAGDYQVIYFAAREDTEPQIQM